MRPIGYKTKGSRYGCDGIRIDGSPEFIDAVLSCLKSILPGDARFENGHGGEVCYIRLHQRGSEAAGYNLYDRELFAATEQYADTLEGK
jgi:hypothetical protein